MSDLAGFEPPASEVDAVRLPGWARVGLGLGLAWHLFAVVIAPASVAPASPLVRSAWNATSPYTRALYLNHGYRFFAPDPPDASTLLVFNVESPAGRSSLRIPTRDIFPRQLYHRHFMLCEQLATVPPPLLEPWLEGLARHALLETGERNGRVTVRRIVHYRPSAEMVRDGTRLDAPASYAEEPVAEFDFPAEA